MILVLIGFAAYFGIAMLLWYWVLKMVSKEDIYEEKKLREKEM